MSFDPNLFFKAMRCAYRSGVLDKVMYMQGQSIQLVMEETGLNLVDLMNRMDETTEDTLLILDEMLEQSAFMCRLATSGILMKTISRILDFHAVKNLIIHTTKHSILKVMNDGSVSSGADNVPNWQDSSMAGEG